MGNTQVEVKLNILGVVQQEVEGQTKSLVQEVVQKPKGLV